MDRYDKFFKRVDLVQNQVARENLAEEKKSKLKKKRIQQQNAQRFAEYQQILQAELEARIFANISSTGGAQPSFSFGNALQFDGANDFLNFTTINFDELCYSFWIKSTGDDSSFGYITSTPASEGVGSSRGGIRFDEGFGTYGQLAYFNGSAVATLGTIGTPTNWNHVLVYTKASTNVIKCWINGSSTLDTTFTGLKTKVGIIGNLYFTSNYFYGTFDEFAIASHTATTQDALDLYNSGNGVLATDVLTDVKAYWRFNESSGASTAVDEQGSYDATLNNFNTSTCWVAH